MPRPKHLKPSPQLPALRKRNHLVTSDQDAGYNCIAYAAGITDRKLWPTYQPDFWWPADLPNVEEVASFIALFESLGYNVVEGNHRLAFRQGFERIAIFARNGAPTHAARQISSTLWVSKLGNSFDIQHRERAVSGGLYGDIAVVMERRIPEAD